MSSSQQWKRDPNPVMTASSAKTREPIDGNACRSISDAVGERLQRDLRPDFSDLSPHLRNLMDELRRRDVEGEGDPPTDFASHT